MSLPFLPTSVVGSYSMPGWLERLKTDYVLRRVSRQELDEIHDTAVKARSRIRNGGCRHHHGW
jgi:5-methyltetrahydropteroyltriglutamate--homocysteine methyltransferase